MKQIALAFHNWMIKNRWQLHSSGQYYYVNDGTWQPAEPNTYK